MLGVPDRRDFLLQVRLESGTARRREDGLGTQSHGISDRGLAASAGTVGLRLVELVDLAYQTVDFPERLGVLLSEIAETVGAGSALLVASAAGERRLLSAGHADPTRDAADVRSLAALDPGTRTVPVGGGLELVLDVKELSPSELALLGRLTPHLSRAFRLAERVAISERSAVHAPALERLPTGVTLLDAEGRSLFMNRAARHLLAAGSPLVLDGGKLAPCHPVSRALLESLVVQVAAPSAAGRRRAGGRLRLPEGEGAAVDLVVVPFEGRIDGAVASCAVFLSREGEVPGVEERLAQLYELSPGEARCAMHLVEGQQLEADPKAEPEKVRETVAALYEKLGSTRQRDLVWLLLRPLGAVFQIATAESRRT